MRLGQSAAYRSALIDLERVGAQLAQRQRELASGRRINTISDDPFGSAAVVRARAEIGAIDRYARASDSVDARLSIADSVLTDVVSQISAALTTVAGASNSGQSVEQREAAATALESIRDGIFSSISSQVAGRYIFSGTAVTTAPYQKNPDGSVGVYQGNAASAAIDIDRSTAVTVTFSADEVLRGSDPADLFTELDTLAAAIRAGDAAAMDTGRTALQRAFDRAVTAQSRVGVSLRAVDAGRLQLAAHRQASTQEASRREDANLAETITELTSAEAAYQASLNALSRYSQLSLLDYLG